VPDDARELDALLEDRGGGWWNAFFADRAKESASPCPLLGDWPDESLVAWFSQGLLAPGRVLELGCGNGRNAVHLASLGCTVDAVDFSERAVEWTQQRARSAGAAVTVQCCSIFDATFSDGSYDLVYDSGCFSEDRLRALWDEAPFRVRELRQMRETDGKDPCFGQGFLWVLLASKRR
jgi:SAM-dependent methyltransferase